MNAMRLGVIGCGKMGRALLEGVLKAELLPPSAVTVYDTYTPAAETAGRELLVQVATSNAAVAENSDVMLLCVKPQGFTEMLEELGTVEDRLLISIAAGIRIDTISNTVAHRHRVIRVMPNTPSLVGRGAAAYALGATATEADDLLTHSLLSSVGYATRVEESHLDAVTAVSGSGPAYIFLMIEALIQGGIDQGLSPDIARDLAVNTVAGAAELVSQTGESPATLRQNVTSPNGTTFAALEYFRAQNFESIVRGAVKAAADRSRELGAS